MKAACRKCLVTANWGGEGEEGKGLSLFTTWRSYDNSRCPLYLIVWALGGVCCSACRHQFAMLPPLVLPGETSCAARVQAWFTGEDAGILRGGTVGNISIPTLVNLQVPNDRHAIWSEKWLCAALWSRGAVWSNVLNIGARNSQLRIPVHPYADLRVCYHISAVNWAWLDQNLQKWSWFTSV